MTESQALQWLAELFEEAPGAITLETPRTSIAAWDSLGVLTLIAGIDQRFALRVSDADIQSFATAGDVVAFLRKHGSLS